MTAPLVAIVVPTYRRPLHLAACLASIEATVDVDHEVIAVTVAGDDDTRDVLASAPGAVRIVTEPARGGFVRAVNLGLRAARAEFVTVINDDCTLLPHTIGNAVRFMEAPAHAGIGQAAFFHDTPVRRNVFAEIHVEDIRYVVCHVRGLCYANFGLARRTLVERLGHFDERYRMYGADPDFSLKVWHEAGLAVVPCPGALVHHEEVADERGLTDRARMGEDNERLFLKWDMDGRGEADASGGPLTPALSTAHSSGGPLTPALSQGERGGG